MLFIHLPVSALIGMFNPFPFNEITNKVKFTPVIVLFVFYILCFLFLYSYITAFLCVKYIFSSVPF
jgi:hypothetical protein